MEITRPEIRIATTAEAPGKPIMGKMYTTRYVSQLKQYVQLFGLNDQLRLDHKQERNHGERTIEPTHVQLVSLNDQLTGIGKDDHQGRGNAKLSGPCQSLSQRQQCR